MSTIDYRESSGFIPYERDKLSSLRDRHIGSVTRLEIQRHQILLLWLCLEKEVLDLISNIRSRRKMISSPEESHLFCFQFSISILIILEGRSLRCLMDDCYNSSRFHSFKVDAGGVMYVDNRIDNCVCHFSPSPLFFAAWPPKLAGI